MAKDLVRVCNNYEFKLRTGRMPLRRDRDAGLQLEKFRRGAARNDEVRAMVGQVVNELGIPSIWWPFYYDFGRTLNRLTEHSTSPEALRKEARMQLELWVSRGLVREVLERVASDCFQMDLTGPIPTLAQPAEPT